MSTVTVREATRILGLSQSTVDRLINAGILRAKRKTPAPRSPWLVELESIRAYLAWQQNQRTLLKPSSPSIVRVERVHALHGKYAFVPTSSEGFAQRKHEELTLEEATP